MKLARSIVGIAFMLLALGILRNTASQQSNVTQMQKKPPAATRDYVPPFRVSAERPISFEEFPASRSSQIINEQYEEALGIIFNDVEVSVYQEGFAHSGTRAISRCGGEQFSCDRQFVMKFSKAPQRRVKVSFGYVERVSSTDEVVLRVFNAAGTAVGEASAQLPVIDGPVPIRTDLEVTTETNEIVRATVSLRTNANNFASLVLDDIDFDDLLPQPDLTIETVQAQLGLDRQLMITAGIRNIGKGSSIPTILELKNPELWESPPSTAVRALKPGEPLSVNFTAVVPADRPRSPYPYTAVVDPKETIRDSDTRNNFKRENFVLALGKPDLTVRVVDAGVDSNEHAFVITEIANIGNAASTPTVVEVESSGQTIGTATVAPVQPQGSILVNVSIPQKPSAGQHNFQAVVNRDKSLDEADLTNNSSPGVLAIPGKWWPPFDVLIPILICVFTVGLLLTYTLVKRSPGRPHIPEAAPPSGQGPSQPGPTAPTFVARPAFDPGRQELSLALPNLPEVALGLRTQSGASSTQIFDGITPLHRGET